MEKPFTETEFQTIYVCIETVSYNSLIGVQVLQ